MTHQRRTVIGNHVHSAESVIGIVVGESVTKRVCPQLTECFAGCESKV